MSLYCSLFAAGTDWTPKQGRKRRSEETSRWRSSSPGTTWQLACMIWSWKTRASPRLPNWKSAWGGRGDPVTRTPPLSPSRVDTDPSVGWGTGFQAMVAGRRIMRTTKEEKFGGAKWGTSFCEGSWENLQTLVPVPHWGRRAASPRLGAGAWVRRLASVWWSLICPTHPATAATWRPTTAPVRKTYVCPRSDYYMNCITVLVRFTLNLIQSSG